MVAAITRSGLVPTLGLGWNCPLWKTWTRRVFFSARHDTADIPLPRNPDPTLAVLAAIPYRIARQGISPSRGAPYAFRTRFSFLSGQLHLPTQPYIRPWGSLGTQSGFR